ncbi:MAG: fused MFS/spermidine synthase [Steroidobacteraceae bacterium]
MLLAILLAGMVLPAAQAEQTLLHSEHSLYRQVLVYEDAGTRCLCFTKRCAIGRQSCQVVAKPDQLVFEYTRMVLGALLMGPEPRRILIVGLGGGTLPRALSRLLPDAQIDSVEIDAAVTRVARDYFGFRPDQKRRVFEEDARLFIKRMGREGQRYDLIILDAYDNEYIPEHLLTQEFLVEARALLAPGGVLAANTFSSSRLYDNESVTYHAVFGDFYNLKSGNRVILVRQGGLPAQPVLVSNAQRWRVPLASLGVDVDQLLPLFGTQPDWDARARVLTDQYSPANLLNR